MLGVNVNTGGSQFTSTSEAVGVIARVLIGEPCLVGEGVDGLDPHLPASTVRPGGGDRVADAAVHQPSWVALVEALAPGGVDLRGGGQRGVEFAAVQHSLVVGEAVVVAGEEDLTWQMRETRASICGLVLSGRGLGRPTHLANVRRNRRRRTARLLVSGRMTARQAGVAGYLHSFLWVIRSDT